LSTSKAEKSNTSGKVEYERERLLGIVNKLMNFQSGSQQPFALVFEFSALLVDNLLIEIAVYPWKCTQFHFAVRSTFLININITRDHMYRVYQKKRNLGISQEIDIVLKTKYFRRLGI
jgi:hypothetical protein